MLPHLVLTQSLCLATKIILEWHPPSLANPSRPSLGAAKAQSFVKALTRQLSVGTGPAHHDCPTQILTLDDESYMQSSVPWPRRPLCSRTAAAAAAVRTDDDEPGALSQHAGYCAETIFPPKEGNCQRGWSGAWALRKHGIASLAECARMCERRCPRCRFVSFTPEAARTEGDCSWFAECSLPLQKKPAGYLTMAVVRNRTRAFHHR